jgi:hypothetical protein
MICPLVGVVVTDEAVIAHADRVPRPVVDVVSAFGENDAVKTKRRAEEKRNPRWSAAAKMRRTILRRPRLLRSIHFPWGGENSRSIVGLSSMQIELIARITESISHSAVPNHAPQTLGCRRMRQSNTADPACSNTFRI